MKKKIALVSVPGREVLNFHDSEKRFWKNYLGLLKAEGVYSISDKKARFIGNSVQQNVCLYTNVKEGENRK